MGNLKWLSLQWTLDFNLMGSGLNYVWQAKTGLSEALCLAMAGPPPTTIRCREADFTGMISRTDT